MDSSLVAPLGLGFMLGLRHALDADHVAAVAAMVSQERSLRRSCLLGTFWGMGHSASLLLAGIAVLAGRLSIPPALERGFEQIVGLVLMALGLHVLLRAAGALWAPQLLASVTGGHEHPHRHTLRLAGRPFLVGAVHGLAGSAGLMLLVVAAMPTLLGGLAYIALFGVGATGGMLLISTALSLPFLGLRARAGERCGAAALVALQLLAGAVSLVFGAVLVRGE
jgi:high-affinity nickel-transport protein